MRYTVKTNTSKSLCSWCDDQAKYRVHDNVTDWTDYACEDHLKENYAPEDLELKMQYKNQPSLV